MVKEPFKFANSEKFEAEHNSVEKKFWGTDGFQNKFDGIDELIAMNPLTQSVSSEQFVRMIDYNASDISMSMISDRMPLDTEYSEIECIPLSIKQPKI